MDTQENLIALLRGIRELIEDEIDSLMIESLQDDKWAVIGEIQSVKKLLIKKN